MDNSLDNLARTKGCNWARNLECNLARMQVDYSLGRSLGPGKLVDCSWARKLVADKSEDYSKQVDCSLAARMIDKPVRYNLGLGYKLVDKPGGCSCSLEQDCKPEPDKLVGCNWARKIGKQGGCTTARRLELDKPEDYSWAHMPVGNSSERRPVGYMLEGCTMAHKKVPDKPVGSNSAGSLGAHTTAGMLARTRMDSSIAPGKLVQERQQELTTR